MNRKGSRVFVNNVGQRCVVNNIFFIRFSMGLYLFRGLNSGKSTFPRVLFLGWLEFPMFQDYLFQNLLLRININSFLGWIGRPVKSLDGGISSDLHGLVTC